MLVLIGKLSLSVLRGVPICQHFSHFSGLLHHFVLAKLASSSIRVRRELVAGLKDSLWPVTASLGNRLLLGLIYRWFSSLDVHFGSRPTWKGLAIGEIPIPFRLHQTRPFAESTVLCRGLLHFFLGKFYILDLFDFVKSFMENSWLGMIKCIFNLFMS